jgi:polyhydroxyalkanoate synthase
VPPGAALPLAAAIPGARTLRPALGHIGMMASARGPATLWPEIVGWIRAHAAS